MADSGSKKRSSSKTKAPSGHGEAAAKPLQKKKEHPAGSRLRDEAAAVMLIACGIFLALSVMTRATGESGVILSMLLKGLFGIAAYILPFYIIIYAILVLMNRMAHINSRTIFFTFLMFVDLTVLDASRFAKVKSQGLSAGYIKDMFYAGTQLDSAGAVGMTLGNIIIKGVGTAGLFIISAAILVICGMLIADTPISVFFDRRRERKQQKMPDGEEDIFAEDRGSNNRETADLPVQYTEEQAGDEDDGFVIVKSRRQALRDEAGMNNLKIRAINLFRKSPDYNDRYDQKNLSEPLTSNKLNILAYMDDESLFAEEKHESLFSFPHDDADDAAVVTPEDIQDLESQFAGLGNTGSMQNAGSTYADRGVSMPFSGKADRQAAETWYADEYEDMAPETDYIGDEYTDDAPDMGHAVNGEYADDAESLSYANGYADSPSEAREDSGAYEGTAAQTAEAKGQSARLPQAGAGAAAAAASAAAGAQAKEHTKAQKRHYELPPVTLLQEVKKKSNANENAELSMKAARLEQVLHDFGVNATVRDVKRGPAVTRYEIQPATGVKVNSIVRLADDIALNLEAKSLRIEAPIPGKAAVGIEVENDNSVVVSLREMIESKAFKEAQSKISFVVGEDIAGNAVVADLKGMPHLLIAGSTGSGKSVCINSIIMSILYRSTPDEVKLILIDPKVVELGNYNGIPHMLIPVVTDPSKAAAALAWAVQEMNDRYKKFADSSVRDLKAYNEKLKKNGDEDDMLPQIVIIIDELADLMMAAAKQVEESICRLAQLARAAGMHLVVATQRPSVDVVTGLIKANVPSRIAFAVSSQVDSRTILDRAGAEKLVGKGDMLFNPLGKAQPERLQGPFVTDDEVNAVIDFWKAQADEDDSSNSIMQMINTVNTEYPEDDGDDGDELLRDAIDLVISAGHASASMLQRRFRIGYNRAGRLIDIMEAKGIIGPSEGSKPRKVLISEEEYEGKPADAAGGDGNTSDCTEPTDPAAGCMEAGSSGAEPYDTEAMDEGIY